MVREVKLGILAVLVTVFMIWGYQYLKGKNIFKNIMTFHAVFSSVDKLDVAAPVTINGYKIGTVSKIKLNPKNVKSIIVSIEVDGNINYPSNAKVVLADAGIVEGKMLVIEFDALCDGSNCAKENDTLKTEIRGFLESLVGEENLKSYTSDLKSGIGDAFDSLSAKLSDRDSDSPLNKTIWDMQTTMENFAQISSNLNILMSRSYRNMDTLIANMAHLSSTLANSNAEISSTLSNIESITTQLNDANLGENLSTVLDTATIVFSNMSTTLTEANEAFTQLSEILDKIESGDGSLSKLLNDKAIYDNLEETSNNLSLLLQDMRLNPRRYVSLSVFGRKAKEYAKPEDDPAYKEREKTENN